MKINLWNRKVSMWVQEMRQMDIINLMSAMGIIIR